MAAAVVTSVMVAGRECRCGHVVMMLRHALFGMSDWRFAGFGKHAGAFHRGSRKRLNRQAQRQQHDDEEIAPI